jgi:hypothetical protein
MEEEEIRFSISGYELVRKEAKKYGSGSSSTIYLPGEWSGSLVACVRLRPVVEPKDNQLPWGQWIKDLQDGRVWRCPYCLGDMLIEFSGEVWEPDRTVECACGKWYHTGTRPRWKNQIDDEREDEECTDLIIEVESDGE